ncbi:DUF6397 family protein [Streptomyces sp. NPDC101132]|uniref:DUF6397 family protein n=1 Tax=Streptomyces sp. NPDC101132 TaxID=3366110 RepID=UPI0037FFB129
MSTMQHAAARTAGSRPDATVPGPRRGTRTGRAGGPPRTVGFARAAEELGLRRAEFETAREMGLLRPDAGPERFSRTELDRIRCREGFPEALRERVRTVGTVSGAALLGTGTERLRSLARCGYVTPAGYRVNRYRALVWLYLARELREFGERRPELLAGPLPPADRERLGAGADVRARNWRGRYTGLRLRRTADPWERAAVIASVLAEGELAAVVPDAGERTVLAGLAPPPPFGHPYAPAAAAVAAPLLRADQPDEVLWYRASLELALAEARSGAGAGAGCGAPPGSVEDDGGERPHVDPGAALAGEGAVLVE